MIRVVSPEEMGVMSSRAQELADAARKLPSVEWAAFLAHACGADQELLDQAKSLLAPATDATDEAQWMKQTRDAGYQAKNAAQATEVDSRLGSAAAATTTSQSLERGTALGRYVVLNQLGSGGMGVVYAAFDPEMNRKVAIKLLRADVAGKLSAEVARARLLREAQAMARLSHPNIVPVHAVGFFGSQVFIVMEYVEGQTLKRWLEEKRPSTKQIVATFLQAGRALAAAHAVQLIHRDFKLDNVLVAADGRVLVTDFGLARGAREAEGSGPVPTSQPLLDTAMTPKEDVFGAMLTQTGSILGTPAYMAPEQLLGQRTDARVDQFSFCVALYEALYGERPFAGDRLDELVREVTAGKVRDPPKSSRVPNWLRQILLKGLKTNAAERYPSMDALLADLEKDPAIARRRWLYVAGVAAVIAIPLIGYRQIKHQQSLLCKGAEKELAGIWNDKTSAGISRAFMATGKPFAQTAAANVGKALDRYSKDWVTMFTQACEATRLRGTQSEELLDLRMECLSRRRAGFQALIEIFANADGKVVERSVDAAQALASLEGCADVAALKAPVRPPADPTVRAKVDELRRKLATANAMHAAGKFREGVTLATQIASEAKALQYRPLEAEAFDQLARLQ